MLQIFSIMNYMLNENKTLNDKKKAAILQFVILFCLWLWAFRAEVVHIAYLSIDTSEMAHVLVLPATMAMLIYLRRSELIDGIARGSGWGIAVMIAGIIIFAGSMWPFSYGYTKQMALIPILAGAVLAIFGWKVLKISLPMLMLLMLSIPLGMRLYASLVIVPETYTIASVSRILDLIPGLDTRVSGTDIFFSSGSNTGIIALGESNRGARLLLACASMGVFITFSEIRSFWRLFAVAITAIPIILFCNFIRLFTWGIITIYTAVSPTSSVMRNMAAAASLISCYLLFSFVGSINFKLFVEDENMEATVNGN